MTSAAETVDQYLAELDPERRPVVSQILLVIRENLPAGFAEGMHYGMAGFVVPLSLYPQGYHCKKNEPLPFLSVGAQTRSINLYHSGIYAIPELEQWFRGQWPLHVPTKLDMGKSCIRLKNLKTIPYQLIGELATRMTPQDVIALYESR